MTAVNRNGVEIDVCTDCRGVWLDRGELEKLLSGLREAAADDAAERARFDQDREAFYRDPDAYRRSHPQAAPSTPQSPSWGGERGERGERGESGEYGYGRKRKRGMDFFDFFD
jgi:hypothetical protein